MKKAKPAWIKPVAIKITPKWPTWNFGRFRRPGPEGPYLQIDDSTSLRPLTETDGERVFFLVASNRSYLQAWLSWIESIRTLADARRFVRAVDYRDVFTGQWVWGIWYQDKLVGLLDCNEGHRGRREISIGYWLAAGYQGKGIATRAARRCVDYLFEAQGVEQILIKVATGNEASRAIAERLGFGWEDIQHDAGRVGGQMVDILTYRMDARQWAARKAQA